MAHIHDVDILVPPTYHPSGEVQDIVTAIRSGAWMHTAVVWLYRLSPAPQMLFQQRDFKSPTFPGLLDCSAAGYLEAGEDGVTGILREMKEELGLTAQTADLHYLGRRLTAILDHNERERKLVENQFCMQWDRELSDLVVNKDELPAVFWVDIVEFLSIENGGSITIDGVNSAGQPITRAVTADDFVYNVDNNHFRTAERIQLLSKTQL